jgi:hypothetical protein
MERAILIIIAILGVIFGVGAIARILESRVDTSDPTPDDRDDRKH